MKSKLGSICSYRKEKIEIKEISLENYISTENMLPNRGGIIRAISLPKTQATQAYRKNDILVSNIRPYFKKIWKATQDGGCSNDVLVFVANDDCDSDFLYYILADDNFFSYAMSTAKGTKMPRGDKTAILQYIIPSVDTKKQPEIGKILRSIDKKIQNNQKINDNLAA